MIAGVPYDAEVEYLETDGAQWINTGVVPGTNTAVETTVTTVTTSQDIPVFGTNSTTSTSASHSYHLTPYRNRWYWGKNIGTPDGEANGGTYANVVGRTWKIRFNFNGTIAVNDVEISADAGIQPPKDRPQLLISLRKGSTGARYGVWRYYNFKVYENGVLVRDLIPVRAGNVGYMYDRVTRKIFGNQGAGAFVLGPDVATPVMGIHRYARPRVVLPDGARRLAYLESTGAQWIDTGVVPDYDTEADFTGAIYAFGGAKTLIGARTGTDDSNRFFAFGEASDSRARFVLGDTSIVVRYTYDRTLHTVSFNVGADHRVVYDGADVGSLAGAHSVASSNSLVLFGTSGYASNMYLARGIIAGCAIRRNGILVRDYFPVAIGQTGYMYDAVTDALYPNKGTGDFVLGEIGGAA